MCAWSDFYPQDIKSTGGLVLGAGLPHPLYPISEGRAHLLVLSKFSFYNTDNYRKVKGALTSNWEWQEGNVHVKLRGAPAAGFQTATFLHQL